MRRMYVCRTKGMARAQTMLCVACMDGVGSKLPGQFAHAQIFSLFVCICMQPMTDRLIDCVCVCVRACSCCKFVVSGDMLC